MREVQEVLRSQVIVASDMKKAIAMLESWRRDERIVKIVEEDKAFSVKDAQDAIGKAYMASEEITVIILGAKIFSPIVQNKLLKVIEEPPANKEFILVTQSKSTILQTIKSRLPIILLDKHREQEAFGLDVQQLSLQSVYTFTQERARTDAKSMKSVLESIVKDVIASGSYDLDEKTLSLFRDAYLALDMGSPPQFILNALLLKLLARKKR